MKLIGFQQDAPGKEVAELIELAQRLQTVMI